MKCLTKYDFILTKYDFIQWGLVMHISFSKPCHHHSFSKWLVTCSVPNIVNFTPKYTLSVNFKSKYNGYHSRNCIWKSCRSKILATCFRPWYVKIPHSSNLGLPSVWESAMIQVCGGFLKTATWSKVSDVVVDHYTDLAWWLWDSSWSITHGSR